MGADKQRVALSPLLGTNSRRISDHALNGTYMRGGYNVELRDGEWWSRQGEILLRKRLGSTAWWWIFDVNRDLTVIANPYYALSLTINGTVEELYTAAVTENVAFTQGSAAATSTSTRTVGQLILAGVGDTADVYRVTAVNVHAMTLDRPWEPATAAAQSCRFIDSLARNTAGVNQGASSLNNTAVQGSAVVYEQLVTHVAGGSGGAIHAASPAMTGGNILLVITSNFGVPVAIDLTAYLAGATAGVKRSWFYNTALATPLTLGSDTATDTLTPRGIWAEVYKGRLFIGACSDPNGKFGSRTVYWSQIGDVQQWHTGITGQTAAPNFKTFDGEGDQIGEMKTLQDSLVIHRQWKQEVCNDTQSLAQPFSFRTNAQGIGVFDRFPSNRVVSTQNVHFIWTIQGPAIFDGNSVSLIAEDARGALAAYQMIQCPTMLRHVQHDAIRRRIYWWGGGTVVLRHPAALPATATNTFTSGDQVQNYVTCFVYDYGSSAFWFEDRPHSTGGGTARSTTSGDRPCLILSRVDGTLVKVFSSATVQAADTDLVAPGVTDDVIVNAQVETPWLDFGTLSSKRLTEVELVIRHPGIGGALYDKQTSGTFPWLRMQVYTDVLQKTQRAGVGDSWYSTPFPSAGVEYSQNPTGPLTFTPRCDGRQFKLVISNALTSAATTAGFNQGAFRISDIQCEYAQQQSTIPQTTVQNGTSISE